MLLFFDMRYPRREKRLLGEVASSRGNPRLNRLACKVIEQWRFSGYHSRIVRMRMVETDFSWRITNIIIADLRPFAEDRGFPRLLVTHQRRNGTK